ncbi:MAG: hypothetical protein KJN66_02085 [Bacteroidia bacterium]|nr:hypothetical protein [Bacteroidia bacterium]
MDDYLLSITIGMPSSDCGLLLKTSEWSSNISQSFLIKGLTSTLNRIFVVILVISQHS